VRLGLAHFVRLTQPSQGQKVKPGKLTLAVFYFTENLKRAWISLKIKNPPYRWVLLSLVTWLGSEPMALKSVRIDSLLIITNDVDDL